MKTFGRSFGLLVYVALIEMLMNFEQVSVYITSFFTINIKIIRIHFSLNLFYINQVLCQVCEVELSIFMFFNLFESVIICWERLLLTINNSDTRIDQHLTYSVLKRRIFEALVLRNSKCTRINSIKVELQLFTKADQTPALYNANYAMRALNQEPLLLIRLF